MRHFKAILSENTYIPRINGYGNPIYNIDIYKKTNATHHLSSYEFKLPIWNGTDRTFKPFESWKSGGSLKWYQSYNASKHDRHEEFKKANLENLLDAVTGLLALLSAQFGTQDFSAGPSGLALEWGSKDYHDLSPAIGSLFRIKFPSDWSDDDKYDFDWTTLRNEPERFAKWDYNVP